MAKERTDEDLTVSLTEIAAACAVITCGGDAEEPAQEAPPPALMSISDIESMFTVPAHAPYKDEDTAEYERTINDRDSEIKSLKDDITELESEVDLYVDEIETLRSKDSVSTISEDSDTSREGSASKTDKRGGRTEKQSKDVAQGQTFEATYYSAYCDTGCTGVTATGIDVSETIYHEGKRVIAVDPGVIPLGSTVKVTTPSGTFEAVSADTGGDINGNRIDILVESSDKAYELGRHKVTVEIIG